MDITNIDINYIELFDLAYVVARGNFEVDPVVANPSKQKRIRKWIFKYYIDESEIPGKVLKCVDKSKSDSEFIEFLFECHKYIKEHGTWKDQLFEKAAADFTDDVKMAFKDLFGSVCYPGMLKKEQGKIVITLHGNGAYEKKLILHTSAENAVGDYDAFYFDEAQIKRDDSGYRLVCEGESYESLTIVPTNIFFDSATVETNLYRADNRPFGDTPWDTLSSIASVILEKENLGDGYFNEKEINLMPLLRDIDALRSWLPVTDEITADLSCLKQYAQKHGLDTIAVLIDKISRLDVEARAYSNALIKLNGMLNETRCEPLWRELYELIRSSQEGYPAWAESSNDNKFDDARKAIEEALHQSGYEGAYPVFKKKGSLRGVKVISSYDQSYFVAKEKNAEYFIKCSEEYNEGANNIQFLTGTSFLNKNESVKDIYSCCFNAKGRRMFKTMDMNYDCFSSADEFARIAAKKAECKRLTKKEKELSGVAGFSWKFFFAFMLVAGGIFGAFMTVGFFLITCLLTLIFTGLEGLTVIIAVPWWQIFVFCLVSFGGVLSIVEAFARRK